ncbi:MAG: hypothetical protein JXB30_13685 [Anaerolineae bacterium]|nr:hypothetical protein [Anaerolineae bacterium]
MSCKFTTALVFWLSLASLACASSTLVDEIKPSTSAIQVTPTSYPTRVVALPVISSSVSPSPETSFPMIAETPAETLPSTSLPFPTLILPTATPYPDIPQFSIGTSWEERDIWAWQFGDGFYTLVLVGGIHGGAEANTVRLSELLVSHFRENPNDVLPGIRLFIIPVANPDGLVRGRSLSGRLNAHEVDLNRNWGCEWSDTAYVRDTPVSPGPRPFSELETMALRTFFLSVSPDAVLFYHSAAGGIFMGECGDMAPGVDWMGPLLEDATGYPVRKFTAYEVSGDATNWLAERNVPAAVVELYSAEQPEFEHNLNGVMALQCHFALDSITGAQPDPVLQQRCDSYMWRD